eukprot:CAMPEP_0116926748 /NCGR_PEP_ID=MMETSP0467-20121206/24914_1 /TAXON_ID=283647 /ORGANISM="Mesodinium pulex, Strain SPMC105" /LENGTH=103 /DNA_ID=CAMNT_0004606073 /DNA_START=505 /DNA_END=816 /DNA_ORIENTATION=+
MDSANALETATELVANIRHVQPCVRATVTAKMANVNACLTGPALIVPNAHASRIATGMATAPVTFSANATTGSKASNAKKLIAFATMAFASLTNRKTKLNVNV